MSDLIIKSTEKTPSVKFCTNGELRIEGRSIPENSMEFYKAPIDWLTEFKTLQPAKIDLHVNLEYFNSSSSILLLSIFRQLKQLNDDGCKAQINWYYSEYDTEMVETGQDFASIVDLPFNYLKVDLSN